MEKILEFLFDLLQNKTVQNYIIMAIVSIAGLIWQKIYTKNSRWNKAMLFFQQGVQVSWKAFVKEWKASHPGEKLPGEIAEKAFNTAKEAAIGYAKKEGWNLLTVVAEETIPVIIKNIVDSRKLGKNV